MRLEDLQPVPGSRKAPKRLGMGLGSGHGKTAGKGHKGSKARKSPDIRANFEGGQMPLARRIPKRGFSNFFFKKNFEVVNLSSLEEKFEAGAEITPEKLAALRLISSPVSLVKILADGDLTKAFTVRANAFSAKASEKIAATGGKAEVL